MLESLQVNDYSVDDYVKLNDNLLYLDYIKNNYTFKEIHVEPAQAYRYQGNFIGLLRELGVEPKLFVYTMYINNINNPQNFDGKASGIKLAIKPPIPKH